MSTEQEIYEAGLLAIVATAREAFVEGFTAAADQSFDVSTEHVQQYWERSKAYAACVKAVETYTGKKL